MPQHYDRLMPDSRVSQYQQRLPTTGICLVFVCFVLLCFVRFSYLFSFCFLLYFFFFFEAFRLVTISEKNNECIYLLQLPLSLV